jgi:Zn-finger nucleic acid-binding protein
MHPHGDTLVCDYCKSVVVPEKDENGLAVLGEATGRSCPVCDLSLQRATLSAIPVLYCTRCHGLLVLMGLFESLITAARVQRPGTLAQPPIDPHELDRRIGCPNCHRTMDTHTYCGPGNVVIDSCDFCLVNWLDDGELARIAHAPDDRENARVYTPDYAASEFMPERGSPFDQ